MSEDTTIPEDISILTHVHETSSVSATPLYRVYPLGDKNIAVTAVDTQLVAPDGNLVDAQIVTSSASALVSGPGDPASYFNAQITSTPGRVFLGTLSQLPTPQPNISGSIPTLPDFDIYTYETIQVAVASDDPPPDNDNPGTPTLPHIPGRPLLDSFVDWYNNGGGRLATHVGGRFAVSLYKYYSGQNQSIQDIGKQIKDDGFSVVDAPRDEDPDGVPNITNTVSQWAAAAERIAESASLGSFGKMKIQMYKLGRNLLHFDQHYLNFAEKSIDTPPDTNSLSALLWHHDSTRAQLDAMPADHLSQATDLHFFRTVKHSF